METQFDKSFKKIKKNEIIDLDFKILFKYNDLIVEKLENHIFLVIKKNRILYNVQNAKIKI